MLRDIKTEVFYPYPPQQVWQVLTNRRALAAWLMDNDFEPRVGHKFRFQTRSLPGLDGTIDCEVIELDEPRRLCYTWQDSLMRQPSIVTWTLEPADGGTRLQLEHRGFKHEGIKLGESMRLSRRWQSHLIHQPTTVTRTLEPVTGSTHFQPDRSGFESHLESVILSSYLSGEWDHLLNDRFQRALARAACDELAFS